MKIQNGFLDVAKTVPSPNKGGHINPTAIIVHDTAGALGKGSSVGWLTNPEAKASAHFVVERDGTISQLVSTNLKAWHAGRSELNGHSNVNNFSVGIEIVNPGLLQPAGARGARSFFGAVYDRKQYGIEERGDQFLGQVESVVRTQTHPAGLWMPYTEAQIDAVLQLCLAIRDVYAIDDIAAHWQISPRRKIDTNPLFPLAWLSGRVLGRKDPPVPKLEVNFQAVEEKQEPPEKDLEKCFLLPEGKLHKWPSLFSENILGMPEDNEFYILDNGMFRIDGEFTPPELKNEELHWVKLRYAYGTKEAWTLFSNIVRGENPDASTGEAGA